MNPLPITIDPEIVSGTLFDWLETESLDAFLENFPSVSRAQAVAVLEGAAAWAEQANVSHHENPAG